MCWTADVKEYLSVSSKKGMFMQSNHIWEEEEEEEHMWPFLHLVHLHLHLFTFVNLVCAPFVFSFLA